MKYSILTLLIAITLVGCKSKNGEDSDNNSPNGLEREKMLVNVADNIITPSFAGAVAKSEALQKALKTFTSDVSISNLEAAQKAWKNANISFQYISGFDYEFLIDGLSGKKPLDEELATFPINVDKVEAHITAGNVDFTKNFDRDTRGFLALDYLLYFEGNSAVLTAFADQKRKDYVNVIADHIVISIKNTQSKWNDNAEKFKTSKGIDAASSTSKLFDRMVYDYENIKNYKVGIPVGRRIGQTTSEPTKVEAYYSGESSVFILESVKTVENLFRGKANGVDGPGFDDYLKSVQGGGEVLEKMNAQFTKIYKKLEEIEGKPFSKYILADPNHAKDVYNILQKQTKYIKSDMQALLGIYITFDSGDGD